MQGELDVVIGGGSFAGLETMLALRAVAEERVSVELWAPDPEFLYRPLAAASPFGVSLVHRFPLGAIAERCGARYIRAALAAVDARTREVRTTQGEPRSYDALVVACGARAVEAVPGALTFRGPPDVSVSESSWSEFSRARSIVLPSSFLQVSPGRCRCMSSR
jgi:sulfide:quinone oxidoreductase